MRLIVSLLLLLVLAACTVTPKHVAGTHISYDAGQQNSGIITNTPHGSFVVTQNFRERYNGLVALYGQAFVPPIKLDAGISTNAQGSIEIDGQHMVDFLTMNRWRKEARPAAK